MAFDDYDVFDDYDEDMDSEIDVSDIFSSVSTPTLSKELKTSSIISESVITDTPDISEEDEVSGTGEAVEKCTASQPDASVEGVSEGSHLGDYKTVMPKIPEDIDNFDMLPDADGKDYDGGMLLVTKRFKQFKYPQIRVSEKVLEHKYMVTSLKALTSTKLVDTQSDELQFDVLIPFSDGDVIRLGVMPGRNLNNFLSTSVFSKIDKEIYLDEHNVVRGDMMFALCTNAQEGYDE